MILGTVATVGGLWALRRWIHMGIVRGLRAPRVLHAQGTRAFGLPPDRIREVHIPTAGGKRLVGWLALPAQATERRVPAVLVMHGWGSNAGMMGSVVPPLHAAGFAVLLVDARCHGHSDDEPFTSMPRFAEDIASGLTWLRHHPAIDTQRLALLGHSVGAAAALLHAAHHDDIRAVVSLSAFAHPAEMMHRFMAEKRMPNPLLGWYVLRHVQRVIGVTFDEIAPLRTLAAVRCPTLLVHGIADGTVPVEDAHRLLSVSHRARLLLVEGDHDLRDALAPHAHTLVMFLQSAFYGASDPSAHAACPSPSSTMPRSGRSMHTSAAPAPQRWSAACASIDHPLDSSPTTNMTPQDSPPFSDPAQTWNQQFAASGFLFGSEPNGWLREHASVWSPGDRVLCVADGEGRNSVWLAEQGLAVQAFDIAETGVAKARELAAQRGVAASFAVADCDDYAWPEAACEGVAAIFVQFADPALRARLFARMVRALKPGGRLVLQGYTPRQLEYRTGGPPQASHLYTEPLLREAFNELDIEHLREYDTDLAEGNGHHGRSALIGLVARRR